MHLFFLPHVDLVRLKLCESCLCVCVCKKISPTVIITQKNTVRNQHQKLSVLSHEIAVRLYKCKYSWMKCGTEAIDIYI